MTSRSQKTTKIAVVGAGLVRENGRFAYSIRVTLKYLIFLIFDTRGSGWVKSRRSRPFLGYVRHSVSETTVCWGAGWGGVSSNAFY